MDLYLLDRGQIRADRNFALDADVVATHSAPEPTAVSDTYAV